MFSIHCNIFVKRLARRSRLVVTFSASNLRILAKRSWYVATSSSINLQDVRGTSWYNFCGWRASLVHGDPRRMAEMSGGTCEPLYGSKGSRKPIARTEVINQTWDHMKSYNPHTFSSRKFTIHGKTVALMKHCLIWQRLHEMSDPGHFLWYQLTQLCKKHHNKVGLQRLAWGWRGGKKKDDCPPSETLKTPHFCRRRNLVSLTHFQSQNANRASNLCFMILWI